MLLGVISEERLIEKIRATLTCVPVNRMLALLILLSYILVFVSGISAQESIEANLCIQKYEDYLHSLGSISYDFRNVVPDSDYSGTVKYNGKYAYRHVSHKTNPNFNFETICTQKDYQQIAFNEPIEGELTLFGYYDESNVEEYSLDSFLAVPEFSGYTNITPPLEESYLPRLLRDFHPISSLDSSSGTDLILLSGTKGNLSIKAWFDPAHNYLLVSLEISQKGMSEGETITKTISFDKFIDVKEVRVPTFYECVHSRVHHESPKGVHESKISTVLDNIIIADNSNPIPFSFQTKIPNGTRVVLFDAQHIEHTWLDGKIVPLTDEAMLALLRGHGFMPGPDSPRFWGIAISIILIVVALSRLAYKYFTSKE